MKRVSEHPVLGPLEAEEIQFEFDGTTYSGIQGDSIASALLANGVRNLRYSNRDGEPRGIYCGIGHCFECRMTVNGVQSVRACITQACDGDVLESQGENRRDNRDDF